ncbi:MAG: hypothetical protein QG657_1179 [Acidobacteriota bacterium]|nr:hypothetical protein [Acidobacteriota bacterium]
MRNVEMKHNKLIRNLMPVLLLATLLLPFQGMAKSRPGNVTYFSPGSFYIYTMASWMVDIPSLDINGHEGDAAAPMVGLGYTLVNFGNRTLINMEFDVAQTKFDSFLTGSKRNWFYTLALNCEYRFFRMPMSAYAGLGGAMIHYAPTHDELVFAANAGLKFNLGKKVKLRAEIRHFWQGWGDTYYWDDDWFIDFEGDAQDFGSAIAMGLEFHF